MTKKITEAIRQKLTEQGFTDVEVLPGSFVVTARDRDGDPVGMLIGPNSTTLITPRREGDPNQAQLPADNDARWF